MKQKFKYDDFVKSVRPNPKDVEPNVLLEGYAGESSEPNHVRLYTDDALNSFIDLPKNAIIHVVSNSREENPLGGCKVWVKQSTVFTYGDPNHANRPKSSFLEGDIMDNFQATNANVNTAAFQPTPTQPTCLGNTPICIGRTPLTCIGKTPVCIGKTPICIGRTPTCLGKTPCIGTTPVTCITRTPTCFGRTPITCLGKTPCVGTTPITCITRTPTCFGKTPITCITRTPITCIGGTQTCLGKTPITGTGCGLNYSTGPITFETTVYTQVETVQVTGNLGTAGLVAPTQEVSPLTPHTPVVKGYQDLTLDNYGFQDFNPLAGF